MVLVIGALKAMENNYIINQLHLYESILNMIIYLSKSLTKDNIKLNMDSYQEINHIFKREQKNDNFTEKSVRKMKKLLKIKENRVLKFVD